VVGWRGGKLLSRFQENFDISNCYYAMRINNYTQAETSFILLLKGTIPVSTYIGKIGNLVRHPKRASCPLGGVKGPIVFVRHPQ